MPAGRRPAQECAAKFKTCRVTLLSSLLALASTLGPAADSAAASPTAGPLAHMSCFVRPRQAVTPNVLLLGETAVVNLDFAIDCNYEVDPRHVVLVLDSSAGLDRPTLKRVREAAGLLIRTLLAPGEPPTKVAIVALGRGATVRCRLTRDPARLDDCLQHLRPEGEGALDLGLREGFYLLTRERASLPVQLAPEEVMIVIANGAHAGDCRLVPAAGRRIKQAGVLLITVLLEGEDHWGCMWGLASSIRYAYSIDGIDELARRFISGPFCPVGPRLERLTLEVVLPQKVAFVTGSAVPPAALQPDGQTLVWSFTDPLLERESISYRIRPLASGSLSSSLRTAASFIDPTTGGPSRVDFPQRLLTVLDPAPRP